MPSCGGQDKLTYTFSAERHHLSAFRPPRLLVPRKRNSGKWKVIAESGKRVHWFTRTLDNHERQYSNINVLSLFAAYE